MDLLEYLGWKDRCGVAMILVERSILEVQGNFRPFIIAPTSQLQAPLAFCYGENWIISVGHVWVASLNLQTLNP